ncbi:MAG: hypothetical protein LC676_19185, partial [Loktanella sp.]|nr:hypothetical protein [Loktanella sp.]
PPRYEARMLTWQMGQFYSLITHPSGSLLHAASQHAAANCAKCICGEALDRGFSCYSWNIHGSVKFVIMRQKIATLREGWADASQGQLPGGRVTRHVASLLRVLSRDRGGGGRFALDATFREAMQERALT